MAVCARAAGTLTPSKDGDRAARASCAGRQSKPRSRAGPRGRVHAHLRLHAETAATL